MAEAWNWNSLWDIDDLMYVTITGMYLTNITFKAEVGSHPQVKFNMNVNCFLDKLSEKELDKLQELIKKLQISKLLIKEPKEVLIQIGNKKPKGSGIWVIPP